MEHILQTGFGPEGVQGEVYQLRVGPALWGRNLGRGSWGSRIHSPRRKKRGDPGGERFKFFPKPWRKKSRTRTTTSMPKKNLRGGTIENSPWVVESCVEDIGPGEAGKGKPARGGLGKETVGCKADSLDRARTERSRR